MNTPDPEQAGSLSRREFLKVAGWSAMAAGTPDCVRCVRGGSAK